MCYTCVTLPLNVLHITCVTPLNVTHVSQPQNVLHMCHTSSKCDMCHTATECVTHVSHLSKCDTCVTQLQNVLHIHYITSECDAPLLLALPAGCTDLLVPVVTFLLLHVCCICHTNYASRCYNYVAPYI